MPPKGRKKKRKRGGDKEKKGKKKILNERETLSYEQQILDNNRQLARIRSRNQELEEEAEKAKEKYRQLEEDRSDVVAYLKRNLTENQEETKELNERLSALVELRKDELVVFKRKEDAMELEYRTMENNLTAEVKLAAGKLNALEDWRLARVDLMQKFEDQEKEIAEQKERLQNTLYEAEKSVVIGKAMMKKEMKERLEGLSEAFRKATNLRIADATHRAVRENIALNRELDDMLEVCRNLEDSNKEYRETDRMLRLQCELFETESKIALEKALKQRKDMQNLAEDFHQSILAYGKAERTNLRLAGYEKISENRKKQCERLEEKIRLLERCLFKAKEDRKRLCTEFKEKEKEYGRLKVILNRVRQCVKEALLLEGDITDENYCAVHLKQNLLYSLREILEDGDITSILKYTASQVENIDCRYTKGSLGFIRPSQSSEKETDKSQDSYDGEEGPRYMWGEEEEEEDAKYVGVESWETLEERQPSCVMSDISSIILSPRETLSDIQN